MPNTIESVKYYACGYCTHNEKGLFKGFSSKDRKFPAGVFLIKHREKGYILYDTGYSMRLFDKGFKKAVYRKVTPLFIKETDMIACQLKRDGIDPLSIKWVVVSHFHPDHIGGVSSFPNAAFMVTEEAYNTYKYPKVTDLVFDDLLPPDFDERVKRVQMTKKHDSFDKQLVKDLFNDGTMIALSIGGHAGGQLCVYLPEVNLFIGADTCWGIDLLPVTEKMRRIPQRIQADYKVYVKGTEFLKDLIGKGIKVVVSHDPEERVREMLK